MRRLRTDDAIDHELPARILSIHRTQNQQELAGIYAAADVFVNPTREDNFPTVNLEAPVHLYDVDEWGQYIYKNSCFRTFNTISMHKDGGAESSKEGLDDAKLIVDGTLNVVKNKGYLYATTGGANIMGNGGGKVIFGGGMPSAGTLWHVTGLSDFGSSNENAANLCNDDGSYTKSTASTTYYNVNGRWFYEEFKDEKPDHTYDFYYLDNGNAGEETWSPAVYSHDKTGLTARMKWFNVTPDEDCPKFNPDPEADLESEWWIGTNPAALYNYNMLGEWHQFIATEQTGVYSGSDNTLYQKDECVWVESGTVDENPMDSRAITPKSFTTTAHGYRNTVSTSNMRNKMANR